MISVPLRFLPFAMARSEEVITSLTDAPSLRQPLLARRGDSCCQKKISSSFAYYLTKAMLPQHDAKLEEIAQLLKNNNVAEVSNSQLFGRFHCVLMAKQRVGSRE